MKRRLLISSVLAAAAALGSGVASANSTYWAQNGLLLEVSADPRDGSDFVDTNPVHADNLELVALNDNVRLRGMTVRFSDGRTVTMPMRTIRVGEHIRVDLPENCGVIQNVQLDYGQQIVDRTPARLQIIPHTEQRVAMPQQPVIRDHRWQQHQVTYQTPYAQPTYYQQQPTTYVQPTYQPSTYTYQPQRTTGWSGYIEGSFRF